MKTIFSDIYAGRRVFVTGHTGFKGAWLCFWLNRLGAEVTGYALQPPTQPSLFEALRLDGTLRSLMADVRDHERLRAELCRVRPEFVFHLAAQAIVRTGYSEPRPTYETNVMGTVNLLEAVRACDSVRVVIVVTSDKCYRNREAGQPFKESDPLGGRDPYSSSKGSAELVTEAYRSSFFSSVGRGEASHPTAGLASVRAGNVIGGGDWAADRIIPDCVRALAAGSPVVVRNPTSVRPWQHVLEPLSGYLWLAALMLRDARSYSGPWNFGPKGAEANRNVRWVVERFIEEWGAGSWTTPRIHDAEPHEAGLLILDSSKATEMLGWRPVWDTSQAVRHTAAWYRDYCMTAGMRSTSSSSAEALRMLTGGQIDDYEADAKAAGVIWALSEGHTWGQ